MRKLSFALAAVLTASCTAPSVTDELGVIQQAVGETVAPFKTSYTTGENAVISFVAPSPGARDWIALAPIGSAVTTYSAWAYTGGGSSGTVSLPTTASGIFVARYFANDGYTLLAESGGFTVSPPATLATSKSSYAIPENVVATFSNLREAPTGSDWITIAPAGSATTTYGAWKYLHGVETGGATLATSEAGSFVVRIFANDTFNLLIESAPFSVTGTLAPSVTTNSQSYTSGQTITATYAAMPAAGRDWVALAPSGSPLTTFSQWTYTNGGKTGAATFVAKPSGSHVIRTFANDSFTLVAQSAPFTVGAASVGLAMNASYYRQSDSIVVTYSGMEGNPTDWLGVVPKNKPSTAFVRWAYTNGMASGVLSFPAAGLTAGDYTVEAHHNNSFSVAKETPLFTVAGPTGVVPDKLSYLPSESTTLSFDGMPGAAEDRMALFPFGASTPVRTVFTGGLSAGAAALPLQGLNGIYKPAALFANSEAVQAEGPRFMVRDHIYCKRTIQTSPNWSPTTSTCQPLPEGTTFDHQPSVTLTPTQTGRVQVCVRTPLNLSGQPSGICGEDVGVAGTQWNDTYTNGNLLVVGNYVGIKSYSLIFVQGRSCSNVSIECLGAQ